MDYVSSEDMSITSSGLTRNEATESESSRSFSLSGSGLSNDINRQSATKVLHAPGSCGFESCTRYDMRYYFARHDTPEGRIIVTYKKGDPEDIVQNQLVDIWYDKAAADKCLRTCSKEFWSRRLGKKIPWRKAYAFREGQSIAFYNIQRRLYEMVDKRAAFPGKCLLSLFCDVEFW